MKTSTFLNKILSKINIIKGGVLISLALLAFTSCDNFLKSEETKNSIIDAIDYNNAPSYVIYLQANKNSGTIKIVQGEQISKKVTDTFSIRFEPEDDHVFIKWEAVVPGIDLNKDSPSNYIEFEDPTSLETKVTFKKAAKNIVIRPVCPERLADPKFNLNDEDQIYSRDSNIILTFNKEIPEACKDKITITIPGLPEGKTFTDYFQPAEINGKEIIIRTKYTQTHLEEDLIPVAGSVPVHIIIPAKSIYYVNKEYSEDQTIYNDKLIQFTYTVNTETSKKTQIKFHIDSQFADYSTMRVNDDLYTEHPEKYSVGTTLNLSYKVTEDYQFYGWKITYTNDNTPEEEPKIFFLPTDADSMADINLSVTYKEDNISQPIFMINNFIDGLITIEPNVNKIPEAYINIDGEHGTFSPGKGITRIRFGTPNHIEFDPSSDYAFIRWQVINEKTNEEIQLSSAEDNDPDKTDITYIRFNDINESKTDYDLVQVPDSETVSLLIKPVLVERPRVISTTPSYQSSGVLRDTTIQVMFDCNMNENSIYFTDPEKQLITLDKNNGDQWLHVDEKDLNSKCYGYVKDGKRYFKNISITNSRTDESLNENFKAPVFENSRTLSIPVDRSHPIAPGVRVSVTLSEGFFYKINDKDISMSRAEKWQYLVNGKTDNEAPTLDEIIIKDSKSTALTSTDNFVFTTSTLNYFSGGKFSLYLKTTDNTAPDASFNIVCEKLYNNNYEPLTNTDSQTLIIEYNNPLGTSSEYGFTNNNIPQLSDCYLDDLDDGIYSMYFVVKDGSGNTKTYPQNIGTDEDPVYPKYYFCLDNVSPNMAKPTINDGTDNSSLLITWNHSGVSDYENTTVSYRKWGDTNFTDVEDCIDSCTLDLDPGTRYEIVTKYYDYARNFTDYSVEDEIYTRPAIPQVSLTPVNDSTVDLICTKPASGNFTNFDVYVDGDYCSGEEIINSVKTNTGAKITVSELAKGSQYYFEVRSYDEQSKKVSLPYTAENSLPSFTTKPNAPKNASVEFNTNTNSGKVSWYKPENGISGYNIYCSTNPEIPEDDDTVTEKYSTDNSTQLYALFTNLTPGKKYYVKAVSYYKTPANISDSVYFTTNTRCAPVTNFNAVEESNTVINLTWTAPAGEYDSYTVSYKPSTISSWTAAEVITQTVNKSNTSARIENLNGGTAYDFKIVVNGLTTSSAQEKSSCKTCPNAATNFIAEKVSNTSFKVTWTTPTGNYDSYNLYYSTSLNSLSSAEPVQITKGITEKTINTSQNIYYIKLETVWGSLKTETQPIVCSLSLENVNNLTAVPVSTSSIELSWSNPSQNFDGINVYKGNQLLTTTALGTSATSYTVTGLSPNEKLEFNVETFGDVNGTRVTVQVPVTGCTYSNPITSLTATAVDPTTINLTYEEPDSSTWEKLYIYKNDEISPFTWRDPSYANSRDYGSDYGITGGTTYTFKIRTLNQDYVMNNTQGATATATVTTPPKPVLNLSCTSLTQTTANLSWKKPDGNFTGVKVYYRLNGTTSWSQAGTVSNNTSTTYKVENLSAGSTYDFMVETYLTNTPNIGTFSQSSISSYNTKPNTPTNFTLSSRTKTSLTFSWTKPSGNFTGYRLYYKTSSGSWECKIPDVSDTTYKIESLSQGTSYSVFLYSYYSDTSNNAQTSTLYKATTPGDPGSFTVKAVNGDTKLSWTAPSNGASKYKVYYRKGTSGSWSSKETSSTEYTFSNATFDNAVKYQFYVTTLYTANSETLTSSGTDTLSFFTPPAELGVEPEIYSDDGMGRIILGWTNPPNRTDISGINIYIDNGTTYIAYIEPYTTGYVTKVITIPNYVRGSSHYFRLEPYHNKNSSETRGPRDSAYLTTSSGNLKINGTTVGSSSLTKVLSSNKTVSAHPTDGGSFVGGRNVTLSQYSIGTYEVTNALWRTVTGSGSNNSLPKTNVSWQQAIAFCNKLSAMQGLDPCYEVDGISDWKNFDMSQVPTTSNSKWYGCKQNLKKNGYHLPTCAQWEFAARGGNPDTNTWYQAVSGVYDWAVMSSYAVYNTTAAATVGSKYANTLGLYDMCGNVWEMLTDWNNYWPAGTFTDPYCEVRPHGTGSGEWVSGVGQAIPYNGNDISLYRAGGCFLDTAGLATGDTNYNIRVYATYPGYFYAPSYDSYTGFRLCRNVTY